jgi:hypothetical protein
MPLNLPAWADGEGFLAAKINGWKTLIEGAINSINGSVLQAASVPLAALSTLIRCEEVVTLVGPPIVHFGGLDNFTLAGYYSASAYARDIDGFVAKKALKIKQVQVRAATSMACPGRVKIYVAGVAQTAAIAPETINNFTTTTLNTDITVAAGQWVSFRADLFTQEAQLPVMVRLWVEKALTTA